MYKINILNIENSEKMDVELEGYPVGRFKKDIKKVTYHEAEVKKSGAGLYQTMVVLNS